MTLHMLKENKFLYSDAKQSETEDLHQQLLITPYLTNGFSHCYQLGESTFIFRGVRSNFYFLSHFSMKFLCANRIAPDGTPQNAASHLGLYCLPTSHKMDARLIWVNTCHKKEKTVKNNIS